MEKNQEFTVSIEDMSEDGAGIGKLDGYIWFIKDAVIGDVVRARAMKMKKNYGFARLMEILTPSAARVEPRCPVARQCGGCQLQAMSYEEQLKFKERKVKNHLLRIGKFREDEIHMLPIMGMEEPWRYRNKAQFPFGMDKNGNIVAGFYAGRTHDIIECEDCLLAASLYYFGKHASDLAPEEAAILIGISNSPSAYDPVAHPDASKEKRNDVLDSMKEVGYLSEEDYERAVNAPFKIVQQESEGTDENYQSSYAIHCAALELMKKDNFQFQYVFKDKEDYTQYTDRYTAAYSEKSDQIRGGGFKIYTSLDSQLQDQLQAQIDQSLSGFTELQDNGKFALQGAGVIVDNKTNYVVAIVGGRGTEDKFNRAYLSARQPGSTIKPLIDYGPAFDTGEYYPTRIVNDHKWNDGPSNSGGRYFGNVTVREALNRSLNTVDALGLYSKILSP